MIWIYIILGAAGIALALFLLDQLLLWAERRGWIYWRKRESSGGSGIGNALLEVHSILEPDKRPMIEVREEKQKEDDSGAPPEPGEQD